MKPKCNLTRTNGNVFALAGRVVRTLKKAGCTNEADEVMRRLWSCKGYDGVLNMFAEYVEIT